MVEAYVDAIAGTGMLDKTSAAGPALISAAHCDELFASIINVALSRPTAQAECSCNSRSSLGRGLKVSTIRIATSQSLHRLLRITDGC